MIEKGEDKLTCPDCGQVIQEGSLEHKCRESRKRLYQLSKNINIPNLTKALEDPITQAICKDIQDLGWIRCSTSNPLEREIGQDLIVTDGINIGLAYYNGYIWVHKSLNIDRIVAWIYKPDLMELQECLKLTTNNH